MNGSVIAPLFILTAAVPGSSHQMILPECGSHVFIGDVSVNVIMWEGNRTSTRISFPILKSAEQIKRNLNFDWNASMSVEYYYGESDRIINVDWGVSSVLRFYNNRTFDKMTLHCNHNLDLKIRKPGIYGGGFHGFEYGPDSAGCLRSMMKSDRYSITISSPDLSESISWTGSVALNKAVKRAKAIRRSGQAQFARSECRLRPIPPPPF